MRDYYRSEIERPRLHLVRGLDGRLRLSDSPGADKDVARQIPVRPVAVKLEIPSPAQNYDRHQLGIRDSVEGILEKNPRIPRWNGPVVSRSSERQQSDQEEVLYPAYPKIRIRWPSLPNFSLPKFRIRPGKKYALTAISVVVVIVLGSSIYGWIGQGGKEENKKENIAAGRPQKTGVLNAAGSQAPQFDTVLPQGKSIEDLGGWVRVSPLDKDPVFAFVDVVNGVQLNVSQQELPQNLRIDTAKKVAELAESFAATEKIVVDGAEAYLGTSIRGPQSVIFVKNDLLILIKSSSKLTNQQWSDYINSLQ